jgi:O-antigen ligase
MRFTAEIVQEQKAWLKGVSPGDAQLMLDQKYITTHMYTGEVGRPDRGYIGFNTHNQFLESLLQNGIPGLLCFVVICAAMGGHGHTTKESAFFDAGSLINSLCVYRIGF